MTLKSNQSLVTSHEIVRSYMGFLCSLDTPVALGIYLRLKYEENDQVVNMSINPRDYESASQFKPDYQAISGLKKSAFLKTSIDKRQIALDKFLEAEERCRVTNLKFDDLMYGGGAEKLLLENPLIFGVLERAAKLIKRILGPIPESLDFRFGPGVTSYVKKHVTTPKKYAQEIDVSPELFDFSLDVMGPAWVRHLKTINLVKGSRIAFVPKDAKTDRTIAIEPHLNGYAQLGIGQHLRSRFKPWVNLSTGQEVNRFLASVAGEWRLATIDLKAASDTIARSLMWYLLPEEWVSLLDSCRSHSYSLDGSEWTEFHKFSSMGNGFTFELESIIFYALSRACGSSRVMTATYGDDIICEAHVFDELEKVLEYCGFQVNWTKSFCGSSFYESCGADFFDGCNVRPFQWKENKPTMVFKMANDISRYARRNHGRDGRFRKIFYEIRKLVPKECDLKVPSTVGDVGFVVDFDEASPSVRRLSDGWCGFSIKALKHRPCTIDYSTNVCGLLSKLDGKSYERKFSLYPAQAEFIEESTIRSSGVYQVGRITVFHEWSGYGPWIN